MAEVMLDPLEEHRVRSHFAREVYGARDLYESGERTPISRRSALATATSRRRRWASISWAPGLDHLVRPGLWPVNRFPLVTLMHYPQHKHSRAMRIPFDDDCASTAIPSRRAVASRRPAMNHRRLLAIILAVVALTASSVVGISPSEASHGTDHHVYARITARLAADGQVEFALQQQLAGGIWGDRIFPRARYFPTTATVDQWLVSSTLTLRSLDDSSSETDVRITARLRADGQIEFALQQRNDDDTWASHIFPRARYFPTNATVGQWLVSSTLSAALPLSAADADRAVLEAFYRATGGQEWTAQTNWLTDQPLHRWFGVDTNSDGRVIQLRVGGFNLTGSIPPELGNLAELEGLALDNTNLTGSIPPELGDLAKLEWLRLDNNNLTGSIPPELGNLTTLHGLYISLNNLSGPIPPELGNLAALEILWLHSNNLSGSIPPELGNLSNLEELHLSWNSLSGSIPPELGSLAKLEALHLVGNNLSGHIPPELGNLSELRWLYLDNNNLAGAIPPELGNLAKLWYLSLSSNDLSGSIPPELGSLAKLEGLYLRDNGLSGSIPPEVAALMTSLAIALLGGNDFTGPVPPDREP